MKAVPSQNLSVLIAAYNCEETIRETLESALGALGDNDEVLVFVDGATDGTLAQISNVTDSRFALHVSTSNLGRSAARNELIKLAKHDLIAILDSDDIALPWRFSLSKRMLRKYDVVFGTALISGGFPKWAPKVLPQYPISIRSRSVPYVLPRRNPFVHSTVAFRKTAIPIDVCYKEILAEEYELWMRMALAGNRMFRTWIPVTIYRRHEKQVTKQPGFYEQAEKCETLNETRSQLEAMLGGKEVSYSRIGSSRRRMVWQTIKWSPLLILEEVLPKLLRALMRKSYK
jgi:glycosyltransferase involved in cell wall biosynthesis